MDCPLIPQRDLGEFARRLFRTAFTERIPYSGTIELTPRCNLNCVHCYINLPANDGSRARELSTGQWQDVIDQAADGGLLWLLFTGGEIFLREDFLPIYEHAKRRGILITLFTNGTLITPQIAEYLVEWPPYSVEITLYGITQDTYESITRVPGSFARCMRGIRLLAENQIPFKLKTMLMTLNQHELWEIKRFAEELGAPFRYDPFVHSRRDDGSREPISYRLSPEEIIQFELLDQPRVDEWCKYYRERGAALTTGTRYFCGAGRTTFHIDAYGQMTPCLMSSQRRYDLLAGSFQEGWREWMPQVVSARPSRWTECRECRLIAVCNNCPARGEIERGESETAPIEFLCRWAHLRAEKFTATDPNP